MAITAQKSLTGWIAVNTLETGNRFLGLLYFGPVGLFVATRYFALFLDSKHGRSRQESICMAGVRHHDVVCFRRFIVGDVLFVAQLQRFEQAK